MANESCDHPTIVIDNGSGRMKAGLACEPFLPVPQLVFPTVIGTPRRRFAGEYGEGAVFVGDEAFARRDHMSFTYPINHGEIDDWYKMEEIWNYIFRTLDVDVKEHPVLMTEPPLCTQSYRENVAETMFERNGAPEVNISVSGLMAVYGTGRTTGFVLDIGEGVTQCIPVFDGYLESQCIKRSDFGGEELNMYLQKILCDMGYPLTTRQDQEHVRKIKETLCFCSLNPKEDERRTDITATYTLPDGETLRDGVTRTIELGIETFFPAEALFNPLVCGREKPPVTELMWQSILDSPLENRKTLMGSVVVCGGSTMFRGFAERLEQELRNTSPPQARSEVRVVAHPERENLSWHGATLFANPSMRCMQDHVWITREDWEEIGIPVVHQRTCIARA